MFWVDNFCKNILENNINFGVVDKDVDEFRGAGVRFSIHTFFHHWKIEPLKRIFLSLHLCMTESMIDRISC